MRTFSALLAFTLSLGALRAEDIPTVMTVRGKEIYSQDFSQPLPKYTGKPIGYATGFQGWLIHGTGPESRGGQWKQIDGRFQGHENPQVKHPSTASFGLEFKNIIVQCQVRFEDVELDKDPAHGFKSRYLQLRTTNDRTYLCSLSISPGAFGLIKDDNDFEGPDQRVQLASGKAPVKVGEWTTVLLEILGDEMTATVNGVTLTGQNAAVAQTKKSFMFVIGTEGSVRDLHIWEASAHPDWPMNRAVLAAKQTPLAPATKPAAKK